MVEHLFRKPASAVTLPEAALIAGLIRAPSALSPWSNYDGALERSHVVLARMRAQGLITATQEDAARRERPRIQPYRQPNDVRAGFAAGHENCDGDASWLHAVDFGDIEQSYHPTASGQADGYYPAFAAAVTG